jgi:plasmid stabilization system protein ParE
MPASSSSPSTHCHQRTDDPDIRVHVVHRYRYKIFYAVAGDAVEIIHVRHTSRRPWRGG